MSGPAIIACFTLLIIYLIIAAFIITSTSRKGLSSRQLLVYGLSWPLVMIFNFIRALYDIGNDMTKFLIKCIKGE